jgi:heterodisulfide reductase subunit B2
MSDGYMYFPGCSLKGTGRAYEESLLTLFRLLDLKLHELEDWNCCGATSYMSINEESAFTLSARNLAIAQKSGNNQLLAPCAACYLVLRKTQDYMQRYPELQEHVVASLKATNLPMASSVVTRHPLEVLFTDVGLERIKSKVVRKWTGGPIACYYGCQAVRPYYEVDKPVDPTRMEALLGAAGIPTVNWALKTKCCGGSLTGTIHSVGVRLNAILVKEAVRKGAKAIVTLCPLCQFNLDAYQSEIRKQLQSDVDIPILYFTQLLGWALGGDPRELGVQRSISGMASVKQWFTAAKKEVAAHV